MCLGFVCFISASAYRIAEAAVCYCCATDSLGNDNFELLLLIFIFCLLLYKCMTPLLYVTDLCSSEMEILLYGVFQVKSAASSLKKYLK